MQLRQYFYGIDHFIFFVDLGTKKARRRGRNVRLLTIVITLIFLTSCKYTNEKETSETLRSDDMIQTHQSSKEFAENICNTLDNLEPIDFAGSLRKKLYCRVDGEKSTVYFRDWDMLESHVSTIDTKHVKALYDAQQSPSNSPAKRGLEFH